MSKIHMAAVLAQIDQYEEGGTVREFSISYAREDGTLGSKARVRKGGRPYATKGGGKFRYNVKESGTLQLFDIAAQQPFAVKIARLITYNGIRIQH